MCATARSNAVMRVTKNMRPTTDSLIMGAAINKPLAELAHREGRSSKEGDAMPTTVEEEEGIWPMLDFAVELHREFAEGGSIGSTTGNQRGRSSLFFLGCKRNLCVRGQCGTTDLRAEGRKRVSERGGIGDPFDRHSRIWVQL